MKKMEVRLDAVILSICVGCVSCWCQWSVDVTGLSAPSQTVSVVRNNVPQQDITTNITQLDVHNLRQGSDTTQVSSAWHCLQKS